MFQKKEKIYALVEQEIRRNSIRTRHWEVYVYVHVKQYTYMSNSLRTRQWENSGSQNIRQKRLHRNNFPKQIKKNKHKKCTKLTAGRNPVALPDTI